MSRRKPYWTCPRVRNGKQCKTQNPNVKQKCVTCGCPRPKRTVAKHMAALEIPYEEYVRMFGERCGICGFEPTPERKLDRDHVHKGDGIPRGLLCAICNMKLDDRVTAAWLRRAADYVERAEERGLLYSSQ